MVVSALSQGCTPIGGSHLITEAEGTRGVVMKIDDRPAVDVLREDVGELLARDLRRIGGYIFAGLPNPGSDTCDYLVRKLIGLALEHGLQSGRASGREQGWPSV